MSYSVSCDAAVTARWSFGDGTSAEGAAVQHTYAAGRWSQSIEVAGSDGTVTHYDLVPAISYQLAIAAPRRARYGERARLQGKLYPALSGTVTVAGRRARFVAPGVFRVDLRATRPGPYVARFQSAASEPVWIDGALWQRLLRATTPPARYGGDHIEIDKTRQVLSFFLRGFAIHGYPDVPPYPASHGCVRVPMWVAPTLYADAPFGSTIYVYL